MNISEPKKILLFRIYQVLNEYSDSDHPLTQSEIISILDKDYNFICERKAVGRNISLLKEAGIEIESDKRGSYIAERDFEPSEIRLLIDSVLCSRHINNVHSKDLIDKLIKLGGKYFKCNIKNVYSIKDWSKSENYAFLYNIDIINESISKGCQVSFDYNKYGIDKKLHKTAYHCVSPYQMLLHNQHYYLMSQNMYWHNLSFLRIDKITNIQIREDKPLCPIRDMPDYKNGIDYKRIASSLPYMFTDKPVKVELICKVFMVDEIIDWFGYDVVFKKQDNDMISATLTASENAMEYWCLQYANNCEVISPASLRNAIVESLASALAKYNAHK